MHWKKESFGLLFFQYVRSDCGDKSKYSTIRKIIQQVLILLLIDAIISLRINEGGFHDEKKSAFVPINFSFTIPAFGNAGKRVCRYAIRRL